MLAALVLATVVAAQGDLLPSDDAGRDEASLLAAPSRAGEPRVTADPRAWSTGDVALELAFTASLFADWIQTRNTIAVNRAVPGSPGMHYVELNPILGSSPSRTNVDAYFLAMGAAQLAVAHLLPHGGWRTSWLVAGVGIEGGIVARNLRMGIGFRF